ncbi:MAG: hypothetical protein H6774_02700 [Pseudomonadales bacterium]|nr:hypothetical protein [Pseudomonadales bacterium]
MDRIFLDTNIVIDLILRREEHSVLFDYPVALFLSPLSVHILMYVTKNALPPKELIPLEEIFMFVSFTGKISMRALTGPTPDFEDNVQLHSAVASKCHVFLTSDTKLLQLGQFRGVEIMTPPHWATTRAA